MTSEDVTCGARGRDVSLARVACAIRGPRASPPPCPAPSSGGCRQVRVEPPLPGPRPPGPTAQWPSSGAPPLGPAEAMVGRCGCLGSELRRATEARRARGPPPQGLFSIRFSYSGVSQVAQWQRACPPLHKTATRVQSLGGKIPGGGRGGPLQCSCLESPMDRGAWRATVPGVAEPGTTEHAHDAWLPRAQEAAGSPGLRPAGLFLSWD